MWRDIFLLWYMIFPPIHLKKRLKFSQNYQTKLRALYTLECRNSNFLTIFCNMTHNSERIFQYFSTKFCPFIPKVSGYLKFVAIFFYYKRSNFIREYIRVYPKKMLKIKFLVSSYQVFNLKRFF